MSREVGQYFSPAQFAGFLGLTILAVFLLVRRKVGLLIKWMLTL